MREMYLLRLIIIMLAAFSISCSSGNVKRENAELAPYPEELQAVIGRGLVGLSKDVNRVFLCWRLLSDDPESVSFNVYRKAVGERNGNLELIGQTERTNYVDDDVVENQRYAYAVRPIYDGQEGESSQEVIVMATKNEQSALVFNIGQDYKQARVATGDLNGDGELEVIIAYANNRDIDPSKTAWQKSEDTMKIAAFMYSGEHLWTVDLGWGIEAGGFYSPVVIWDLDGDGRAEVLVKTNKSADPLDYSGERLSVLDSETGKVKMEAKWPPVKGIRGNYNSNSRNYIAIAHLDGKNPYIIVARGLYKTQRIWAYDNKLNRVWERIIGRHMYIPFPFRVRGLWGLWRRMFKDRARSSHSLPIADVNDDGKEEIFWGEHCIGENGRDLWIINERMPYNGHPDIVFIADILPSNKGKEIYYCREGWGGRRNERIGMLLANNKGKVIWARWEYTHVDGGWVAKILPDQEGMQCYGFDIKQKKFTGKGFERSEISSFLWSSDGNLIANPPNSWVRSFPVDWDGDGVREICMRNGDIQRYNGPILATIGPGALWGADLFGDHREEVVAAPKDSRVYIYFNTNILESSPIITRIADRQYKNDLSRTAMQQNVVPTEGGYIPKKDKSP